MLFIQYAKCTTCKNNKGNTAQLGCANCEARFFVRLYKKIAGLLTQVKRFLCSMTETDGGKACAAICAVLPKNGMLVEHPLLVDDGFVLVGFKETEWAKALQK